MSIRATLYDATGTDSEVTPSAEIVAALHARQLLWIDVSEFDPAELQGIVTLLQLSPESIASLKRSQQRPRLDSYRQYVQLNINTIQDQEGRPRPLPVHFVLAPNMVVSIHQRPVAFLDSFDRRVKSDSDLGELDAASLLAALLDWHVTAYFRIVEELESAIDKIDAHALRPRHRRDLLSEMAHLRQRVAFVRRLLTPHREVYAAMVRPDFQTLTGAVSLEPFGKLSDRLERAIDAVENARELLVGSFDIFTTQTNLRTSEAMKVLALVSFVWLPASVIVGIAALLLHTPINPMGTPGFWIMIGCIGLILLGTVCFARWRRWI